MPVTPSLTTEKTTVSENGNVRERERDKERKRSKMSLQRLAGGLLEENWGHW